MSTANADDNATPSCFSGILRRLLCSGSPSSSNHNSPKQPDTSNSPRNHFQSKSQNAAHSLTTTTTNPGVIARLMGLDSLPVPEGINWTPKPRTTLESILRSKSVNSFDFVPQFDMKLAHHRRVRTSVSFREAPTFLSQEKHDLFVLCLEKLGKSEMGLMEEHKVEEEKNRGNRVKNNKPCCLQADDLHGNRRPKPRRETRKTTNSGVIEATNQEEKHIRTADSKMRRRKKESSTSCKHGGVGGGGGRRRRRIQPVCALEDDSGSGSLLHLPNITDSNHHEMIATRPEDRRARISNSTRKPTSTKNTSTREYDNVQERKSFKDDRPMRTKEETSTTTTTTPTCDVQELVEICKRLAEEEGLKDSIWTANRFVNSFEHIEEICTLFEQQILDLMFDQLIDDLVEW